MCLFSCLCVDAVVDGGWSRWSPWSRCDKRCGGGRSIRTRSCSSPPPKNGGKKCEGEKNQVKPCNTKPCGETDSPCSLALAKFRSRIVHPVQRQLLINSAQVFVQILSAACDQHSWWGTFYGENASSVMGKFMTFCLCIVRWERVPARPGVRVVCQPVSTAVLRPPAGHRVPGQHGMSTRLSLPQRHWGCYHFINR